MLHTVFSTLLGIHVFLGGIALTSFWIPIFARKRRGNHTRYGKIFAYAMMATAASAGIVSCMTLLAPAATHPEVPPSGITGLRIVGGLMLGYLAAITFVSAYSGLRAVRLRGDHSGHRAPGEIIANVVALGLAVATLVVGIRYQVTLMIALSIFGLAGIPGNFRFIFKQPKTRQEWLFQHIGSMLGAGIAAHTAFLVFGLRNIAPALANEPLAWLAPAMLGVPASVIWQRHYRKKFAARAVGQPVRTGQLAAD